MGQVNAVDTGFNNQYQAYLNRPMNIDTLGGENTQPIDFGGENTQPVNFQANPAKEDTVDNVKDGKDDGNIGFWRATGNFFKGVGKFFWGMVSDENGDFSIMQTLKTAAIAVAIGAICVLTAGTAIPAIIAAGGCILAAGSLAKGAYNVATAETDAEAENAWQQVGSGTTATVLAAVGAKAVAKGMHVEAAEAGEFDGVSGTWNAVKTVFKDSGSAIKDSAVSTYEAASGASGAYGKYQAVKNNVQEQYGELANTVKTNYNNTVYGSQGKIASETKAMEEEVANVTREQAKLDPASKEYAELAAKKADLEIKIDANKAINSKSTYAEAKEVVDETSNALKNAKEKLAEAKPENKEAAEHVVKALETKLKAEKSALNRRTLEARAIRDDIEAKNKKIDKLSKNPTKNAEKIADLKAEIDALKQRQDFEIPTKADVKAAAEANKDAMTKAEKTRQEYETAKAEYEAADEAANEAEFAELSRKTTEKMEQNNEAKAAYEATQKELNRIANFRFGYGNYANTGVEVGKAILANPGATWMTIYTAGKNSQTTPEARMMSNLTPEERKYVATLSKEQREALVERYKQLYVA